MDDPDRVIAEGLKSKQSRKAIQTATIAGLLVLLGAGCGKAAEPVAQVIQPNANPATTTAAANLSSLGREDGDCLVLDREFYGTVKSGQRIAWDGKFSFVSSAFQNDFTNEVTHLNDAYSGDEWEGEVCVDQTEQVVFLSVSTSTQNPGLRLPDDDGNTAGVRQIRTLGFWKAIGFGGLGDRIVFSPAVQAYSGQENPLIEAPTLRKNDAGYVVTQHISGDLYLGKMVNGWPEDVGTWSADTVFDTRTGASRIANYQTSK